MDKEALGKVGNTISLPAFALFPVICYVITKRWEREMEIPRLAFRVSRALVILLAIAAGYFYIIPRLWFRAGTSALDRALIRVIIHPVLFESASLTLRIFVRSTDFGPHANQAMVPVILNPQLLLSSLYGRFLIASSGSYYVTIAISLCVGAIECILRLSSGKRDWCWFRLFKGKEYADAMTYDPPKLALRARLVALDAIIEWYAIITGSIVQYLFVSSAGVSVTFSRMLANIFGQLAIEILVTAVISILEERYAKVPVRREWWGRGRSPRFFWGHFISLSIYTLFTIATLMDPTSASFLTFSEAS